MLNSPNGMTSSMLPSLLTTVSQSSLLVQNTGANQLAGLGGQQQPMGQFPPQPQQIMMSPYGGGLPVQPQPYGQPFLPPGGRIVTAYTQSMYRAYIPPSPPPVPYPGMGMMGPQMGPPMGPPMGPHMGPPMGPPMGPQMGFRGGWF